MQLPVLPENMPHGASRFWSIIGLWLLRIKGWQIEGELPNYKKAVLIVAPHTSNWDFVIGMAAKMAIRLQANWLGKHTIFKGPANQIFRGWGGIPVERSSAHNMVDQVVEAFNSREKMWLGLSPEGTRGHVDKWKSGFWHIAKAAGAPILAISFDYPRKTLIIGKSFVPGEDLKTDMAAIRSYFAEVGVGKIRSGE